MRTLRILLSFQSDPSPSEVEREYRAENEKVKFEYAKINVQALKRTPPKFPGRPLPAITRNIPTALIPMNRQTLFREGAKISTANDEKSPTMTSWK